MKNSMLLSPINDQDFIWIASYMDGTSLSEFSSDSKIENSFYNINKEKLIRFGLIGHGMNLYFEVYGGEFKLAGRLIEFSYKDKKTNIEYPLTGHVMNPYNDIKQFKNASSSMNKLSNKNAAAQIDQYNFGYCKSLHVKNVYFNIKAICSIPYGNNVYITLDISSDQEFEDGLIISKTNGVQIDEIDAPMKANKTYQIKWIVT